jgi:hypothetical protein
MATALVNGEHLLDLSTASIASLPEQFGLHDLELLLTAAAAKAGVKLARVKDVFVHGRPLDKKKNKGAGFVWRELDIGVEDVIGVHADVEGGHESEVILEEEVVRGSKKNEDAKIGGKKKTGRKMEEEKQKLKMEKVGSGLGRKDSILSI